MDFVREMLSEVPATIRSEPPHHGDVRDTAAEVRTTAEHRTLVAAVTYGYTNTWLSLSQNEYI